MLLAGVGELSKVLMIFLIIVFQVVIAVRDSIRTIPSETYYPLCLLGASFPQVFRDIILPASLPKFITAVRVAMATAVSVLFTETFGTRFGMGYFIMDAWLLRVNYLEMYAGIVVLSFIGLLLFGIIDLVEHYVMPMAAKIRRRYEETALFCCCCWQLPGLLPGYCWHRGGWLDL